MPFCHKKRERCFCIKGITFPICARCFGFFISFIPAIFIFLYDLNINMYVAFLLILILILDWFCQWRFNIESNNKRRFFTGLIAGIGFSFIIQSIFNIINY